MRKGLVFVIGAAVVIGAIAFAKQRNQQTASETWQQTLQADKSASSLLNEAQSAAKQSAQSISETASVTSVSSAYFHCPLVIARVSDQVTGRDSPIRSMVLAAEKSQDTGDWLILRDWEAVRRLNEVVVNSNVLRMVCTPLEQSSVVKEALNVAMVTTQVQSGTGEWAHEIS